MQATDVKGVGYKWNTGVQKTSPQEEIELVEKGTLPDKNEAKLRLCAYIVSSQYNAVESKKIELLGKLLAEVTKLDLVLCETLPLPNASPRLKGNHFNDAGICLLTKALAQLIGPPESTTDNSIESLINVLLRSGINITSFDSYLATVCFEASPKQLPCIRLKTGQLKSVKEDGTAAKTTELFRKLANQSSTLTSLSIRESDFLSDESVQIFDNNSKLSQLSLHMNWINEKAMLALAKFIKGSTNLRRLSFWKNNESKDHDIVICPSPESSYIGLLSSAISENTSLSSVEIIDQRLPNWIGTKNAILFFENLKKNSSLNILTLASPSRYADTHMLVPAAVIEKMQEVLKFNSALVEVKVEDQMLTSITSTHLAANKKAQRLETNPELASLEVYLCAQFIPTELLKKIDRYIALQSS